MDEKFRHLLRYMFTNTCPWYRHQSLNGSNIHRKNSNRRPKSTELKRHFHKRRIPQRSRNSTVRKRNIFPKVTKKKNFFFSTRFIEVRGLQTSSITKRKQIKTPVLKSYEFVPNMSELSVADSLQVILQIVMENSAEMKLKVTEILSATCEPLAPIIQATLKDHPLIQPNIHVFTNRNLKLDGVLVQNKSLAAESDCNLVIGARLSQIDYVSAIYVKNSFYYKIKDTTAFFFNF